MNSTQASGIASTSSRSMAQVMGQTLRIGLLLWLVMTMVIGLQAWIGDETIYAPELEEKREMLHFAVLNNKAPGDGAWGAVGALSLQKRVGVVYLAESIRHLTGFRVGKIYQVLDTVFLFMAVLALYFYLRRWVPDTYCLIGVLYFCAALPLTYFFQLFHPWDRLQLALWIVLLHWVAQGRFVFLAVGLVLSILVKFDTVLLPIFYGMAHVNKQTWRSAGLQSIILLGLALGTYAFLGYQFPAPQDVSHFTWASAQAIFQSNVQALSSLSFRYPPLLVHALPLFMALFFLGHKDRFVRASVVFALVLSLVHATFTHYEEVRAHMVVLVLLLPSALISLMAWLEGGSTRLEKQRTVISRWASRIITLKPQGSV